MKNDDINATIGESNLFRVLDEEQIASIARLGSIARHDAGYGIYRQGEAGRFLYIIKNGEVHLSRTYTLHGDRRVTHTVLKLGQGRIMGCWLGLTEREHVHMCTATCQRDTELIVFECEQLREVIASQPSMGARLFARLIQILKNRLETTYGALEIL